VSFALRDGDPYLTAWRLQRRFYFVALAVVVVIAVVGGIFVWRNVRRELRCRIARAVCGQRLS
jgi:hypothetical protein